MPINRFFIPQIENQVIIKEEEHHHLSRVMRHMPGDSVELIDGNGHIAIAKIDFIDKKETRLTIESINFFEKEKCPISLALPLMRSSKLEWVVEKAVELGAFDFYFYKADRSDKEEQSAHKIERMEHLIIAAMKQSGRLYLPKLYPVTKLQELLQMPLLILYGDTDPSAPLIKGVLEPVLLITGPESGFSEKEKKLLQEKGRGVKINQHILRAETAPIAALSILKALDS